MRNFRLNFLIFLLILGTALAADRGVEVRPNAGELIEIEPKKTVTSVFRITSKTPGMREFVSEAVLPEGWKLITPDFPLQLAENQSEIKLLSFFVPQTAAAGVYEITYSVHDREFPSNSDSYTLNVHVLAYRNLGVKIMDIPRSIIAGEPYTISFLLSNDSNVADSVRVSAVSLENSLVTLKPNVFFMGKGETRTAEILVRTDPKKAQISKDRVQIQARFIRDKEAIVSKIATIDLIPRITGKTDRHYRLPVDLTLSQVFENSNSSESGFQATLSGEGALGEGSDRKVKFGARGPDIYQTSIYGKHDEYFAQYDSKRMGLHAGDKSFRLTPLMEQSRYGRGVETRISSGRFEAGGYAFKTRWYIPEESQAAGYARYKTGANTQIGLQFLHKDVIRRGGNTLGLSAQWTPERKTLVEAEAALGSNNGETRKGFYAKASSERERIYYYINLIYSDPGFPGYYQDTRIGSGGITLSLRENLRINAVYRYERQKYTLDTLLFVAPLSQYAQFGLSYRFSDGTSINLDAIRQSREDRYPVPRFNYEDTYGRINVTKSFATISLNAATELGRSRNHLTDQSSSSVRFNGSVQFRPAGNQTYRGYVQYDDNARYGGSRINRLTFGVNAILSIKDKTQFSLNYQNNHSLESYYFNRDMFELEITQKTFGHQSLSVRARRTLLSNSTDRKETAVMVDYHIPWGIPVGTVKGTGMVSGRIFDQETLQPIADVIVRINGSSAVTDAAGNYIFPNLKPGTYYLRLDKVKIGLNRVTTRPTPMEMVVKGGDKQKVDLGVIRGASYSGRVILCKTTVDSGKTGQTGGVLIENGEYSILGDGTVNRPGNGKEDCAGLSNILIEMTSDGETLRRLTDAEGRFQFDEVRPGIWDVKMYPYNLPEYHRFDQENFQINLPPGDAQKRTVNVLPKKRKVQFLQEDGTVIEQKTK